MAIAYDNAIDVTYGTSSTHTRSFTVGSGSNRLLVVPLWFRGASSAPTSVTYSGVNLTQVGTTLSFGVGPEYLSIWALLSPATGTNDLVVTFPGLQETFLAAVSYSGCSQTGLPDALVSNTGSGSNTTGTVTTVADNSWAVMIFRDTVTGTSTAGSGTIRRANGDGFMQLYDGNGAKTPAGSYTLSTVHTSQPYAYIMFSFAPYTIGDHLIGLGTGQNTNGWVWGLEIK